MFTLLVGENTLGTEILEICADSDRPTGAVYSSGNAMTIRFRTDSSVTERGFLASVQAGVYLIVYLFIY